MALTPAPSLEELRAVCQPQSTLDRRNAEHWLARLVLRDVSLRITRQTVRTSITANAVTVIMIVVGLVAAVPAGLSGLWAAILAWVLVIAYFLLDLVDGEVARWREATSITGVYLDRVGHYFVECALLSAYGFRAAGQELGGWSTLGVASALMALLVKAESDLVDVARARKGYTAASDESATPRSEKVAAIRKVAAIFKIHQVTGALESSTLLVVAATVDHFRDDLLGTRCLVLLMLGVSSVMALVHLLMILASRRLD